MNVSASAACPFCQSKNTFIEGDRNRLRRACSDCEAKGPPAATESEADRLWGRRPLPSGPEDVYPAGPSWTVNS